MRKISKIFITTCTVLVNLNATDSINLESILVTSDNSMETTAGETKGYKSLTADSATKTRTPLKQIPKSIQVINSEIMNDQQVQSVSEALHNSSGIVTNNPLTTSGWDGTLVRGFAAEQLQDGTSLVYNTGDRESTINIERIEVLKGPNAILYGGNSGTPVGGSVNLISKLPEPISFSQLGITIGSNNLIKPSFDINQPIAELVLLRVTGEYTKTKSQNDVIERNNYNINPTVKLKIDDDTTVIFQGKTSRWKGQDYQGLPAVGTIAGDFKIDKDLFVGEKNLPDSKTSLDSIATNVEHRFNDIWSVNTKLYAANSEFDERLQLNLGNEPMFGSTFMLLNTRMYQEQQARSLSADVKAEFSMNTKLVFGAEMSSLNDKGFMDNMNMSSGVQSIDLLNPIYSIPYKDEKRGIWSGEVRNRTSSIYAQIQQNLFDKLHLLIGTKLSKVVVDFEDTYGGDNKTDKTKLLLQGGFAYDINDNITLFTSYSEGMKAPGWSNYEKSPKPMESKQYEAGIKFDTNSQLSGSLAVFKIERKNISVANPATNGLTTIPNGEEESKGIELDLLWQPTTNFSLLSNYTNTHASYTKNASSKIFAGNKLGGVPNHSARIWANYKFNQLALKGFSVGAGIYAQSSTQLDGENKYKIPSYYTYDAKIGYKHKSYETSFVVKNLTDKDYYERLDYYGGRVTAGMERTYLINFNVKF
ncbi:TonB-dependent siderophore receptor [Arcobacter sp.]|uniref:TonB-dependent siderophore receptor n=1 Tax=unclassified Arcobacter TaxID=2593671 RepID=UPI003B007C3A